MGNFFLTPYPNGFLGTFFGGMLRPLYCQVDVQQDTGAFDPYPTDPSMYSAHSLIDNALFLILLDGLSILRYSHFPSQLYGKSLVCVVFLYSGTQPTWAGYPAQEEQRQSDRGLKSPNAAIGFGRGMSFLGGFPKQILVLP